VDKKWHNQPTSERWTARHKADTGIEIIRGQKTIVDVAREYDLKRSEIQKWMETFLEYGCTQVRFIMNKERQQPPPITAF
jgi:transposase-like protein